MAQGRGTFAKHHPVLPRSAGAQPRGTAGETLQDAVQVFAAVTLTRAR